MWRRPMDTFDKIYVLDLPRNVEKTEVVPDGTKDESVLSIRQNVVICLIPKLPDEESAT